MDERERVAILETALAQMLKPVRGIPFNVVVKALADRQVFKVDLTTSADTRLLKQLGDVVVRCAKELRAKPIRRPRPNEVGNDLELYVARALVKGGFAVSKPMSRDGRGKATGYPDLLFNDAADRPIYLECKIYGAQSINTTLRSFYLSPSDSSKVALDAHHLLLAFGMSATEIRGSRNSLYTPTDYKIIDLHDLLCDVKYEFNSDNRRLYADGMVLASGTV